MSFRWVVGGLVPGINPRKQAVLGLTVLIVAGCGGGGGTSERVVRGTGYHFGAPVGWSLSRSARGVQLTKGVAVLSVTRFPLLRAYRPALWEHVLPELDRAAAAIAAQQNGTVRDPRTVTIAGRRARRYDIAYERSGQRLVERISFILLGKTEYLLLCRYLGGGDTEPCDRLLATFRLG